MSFDLHSTPSLLFSTLPSSISPALSGQLRFNLNPAPIHAALEVTVLRNPTLAQKEEKQFAISGKQKDSAREETNAVSGTSVMSGKTDTTSCFIL